MISSDNAGSFSEILQAITSGDETVTNELTAEIVPELLGFAIKQGAQDVEGLVGRVLLDAFRKSAHFSGTKKQFVATLCRVIDTLIQNETPAAPTATVMPNGHDEGAPAVLTQALRSQSSFSPESTPEPKKITQASATSPSPRPWGTRRSVVSHAVSPTPAISKPLPKLREEPSVTTASAADKLSKTATASVTTKPSAENSKSVTIKLLTDSSTKSLVDAPATDSSCTLSTETLATNNSSRSPEIPKAAAALSSTQTPPIVPTTLTVLPSAEEKVLARSRQLFIGVGLVLLALPLLYLLT